MDKRFSRAALMILGVLLVLIGIGTFITPKNLPLAGGIGVFLYGLGAILNWREKRKVGFAKKTTLASAIITMAAGLAVLAGGQSGFIAINILVVILALWLIVAGVLEIIGAIIFRKAMTTADLGVQAPGSVSSIILGVVLIVSGIFSLFQPLFAVITTGILISMILIVIGIRMVVSGLYSGALLRKGAQS